MHFEEKAYSEHDVKIGNIGKVKKFNNDEKNTNKIKNDSSSPLFKNDNSNKASLNTPHSSAQDSDKNGGKNSNGNQSNKSSGLKRSAALRKKDLILNSFYYDDFGDVDSTKKAYRINKRKCMIYPEDTSKVKWDLFITL